MTAPYDPYIESLKNEITTLRAELDAAKSRINHLEANLNAALTCATVGDTFKARQFMAKGLLQEQNA